MQVPAAHIGHSRGVSADPEGPRIAQPGWRRRALSLTGWSLLVISVKTVERHRANILQKLEMRDRTELTRYAIRTGLIES